MDSNPGLIYQLIPRVMADIGAVAKDSRNEQQKYLFRGIEAFYLAAHPAFVTHGIFCVPEVIDHASVSFDKTNEFGKTTTWRHVTIKVKHQFFASDGSHVDVVTMGEGLDNSDKATNKAMSGAMKYALIELFTVPTQDVEDSDRTSPETGRPRTAKPAPVTTVPIPVAPPNRAAADSAARIRGAVDPQKAAVEFVGASAGKSEQSGSYYQATETPEQTAASREALAAGVAKRMPQDGGQIVGREAHVVSSEAEGSRVVNSKRSSAPTDPDECIDLPEQRAIIRQAREATTLAAKDSEVYFREYLAHAGYKDAEGRGSTKKIPKVLFEEFKRECIQYMSTLK